MEDVRIIEVKQSVFADNNADAQQLRVQLKAQKTFLLNYNNYAVRVTYNGVTYTVPSGGYVIITH